MNAQTREWIPEIAGILRRALGGKPCRAWLFGSRAAEADHAGSDFDIALLSEDDISGELAVARDLLEESSIPFEVDLVDLSKAAKDFVRKVSEKGVPLWS